MEVKYFIARSSKRREPNWTGKEWSNGPAYPYHDVRDLWDRLDKYWLGDSDYTRREDFKMDSRTITIVPLTEEKARKLLALNKISH